MPVSAGILSLSSNRLNLHTRQVRSVLVGYNEGEMSATVLFLCLLHKDQDQDKFSNDKTHDISSTNLQYE